MAPANYELLAAVFAHPGSSYEDDLARATTFYENEYPAASRTLREFGRLLPKGDLIALQELYMRTFIIQPITSLDIGYTLFGEDYKRGAILAGLGNEHVRAQNDCGGELGDHLTNVLRLLPKLTDLTLRDELVEVLIVPALLEMIREFDPERMAAKEVLYKKHLKTIIESAEGETRTAYRYALKAVQLVLQADFALKTRLPIEQGSKFVDSVGAEMGVDSADI